MDVSQNSRKMWCCATQWTMSPVTMICDVGTTVTRHVLHYVARFDKPHGSLRWRSNHLWSMSRYATIWCFVRHDTRQIKIIKSWFKDPSRYPDGEFYTPLRYMTKPQILPINRRIDIWILHPKLTLTFTYLVLESVPNPDNMTCSFSRNTCKFLRCFLLITRRLVWVPPAWFLGISPKYPHKIGALPKYLIILA